MRLHRRVVNLGFIASLIFGAFAGAGAQANPPAPPKPWGLFSARYDTHSSDFIYAVYGYGRTFAMVGTLQNPRTDYTELLGAIGRTFASGDGPTQSMAVGAARTDRAWYAQLYYLPSYALGLVNVRATTELDVPTDHRGTLQFGVSPLSLTLPLPVTRTLELGVAIDVAAARGDATSSAIGPELRLALPNAVLGTDLERMLDGRTSRARLFFTTQF